MLVQPLGAGRAHYSTFSKSGHKSPACSCFCKSEKVKDVAQALFNMLLEMADLFRWYVPFCFPVRRVKCLCCAFVGRLGFTAVYTSGCKNILTACRSDKKKLIKSSRNILKFPCLLFLWKQLTDNLGGLNLPHRTEPSCPQSSSAQSLK